MENDVVIKAEQLGKKYLIGHENAERGRTLRDAMVRGAGNIARMAKALMHGQQIVTGDEIEEFWALRDLNFEIRRGDVVAVIGRNGAGKSTLLKVLSRITEPTEGRVLIKGRIASLLEVGTGFHPELSGRENIYLNGAILGMNRNEIRRKFDDIVEFSEVEKFLDTPVKRYSSGMYVRLAFAVAAHLEPEILIIDEVLAVGDAKFQSRCFAKIRNIAQSGQTILLVSHNPSAVASLSNRAIWLDAGTIRATGATRAILTKYLSDGAEPNAEPKRMATEGLAAEYRLTYDETHRTVGYDVTILNARQISIDAMHFFLHTSTGLRAAIIDLIPAGQECLNLVPGQHTFKQRVDVTNLSSDNYAAGFHLLCNSEALTDWALGVVRIENTNSRYPIESQGPASLQKANNDPPLI